MTLQTLDFTTKSDAPAGQLPNFDTGQVGQTLWLPSPSSNGAIISAHGATLSPTQAGATQGWYYQWNAPARPTVIATSWLWTEVKAAGNNNGPVGIFMNGPLVVQGGGLSVPSIAAHFGCSMLGWHLDFGPPGFFGFPQAASGTWSTPLLPNTVYTMAVLYTASDTVKFYLPDGTVTAPIQNSAFNINNGNWGCAEIYLGNAINESNVKITKIQTDTVQWPTWPLSGSPPPPPPTQAVEYSEPYCRTEGFTGPDSTDTASANTWAQNHITSAPGHVVEIKTIWK